MSMIIHGVKVICQMPGFKYLRLCRKYPTFFLLRIVNINCVNRVQNDSTQVYPYQSIKASLALSTTMLNILRKFLILSN